jgi:hypothetical protein
VLTASSNRAVIDTYRWFMRYSDEAELLYLEGLRFLPPGAAKEALAYRTETAALDALLSTQTELTVTEVEVEERDLRIKQLQSSLRDAVHSSLQRVLQLQVEHAAQRQALLAGKQRDEVAAADRLLNPLQPPPGGPDVRVNCCRFLGD